MTTLTCYACQSPLHPDDMHCSTCGSLQVLHVKYRLLRVLGNGGFGIVYEAAEEFPRRHCAIKQIRTTSAEHQHQIQEEANILARYAPEFRFMPIIYNVWSEGQDTVYLSMEYIRGQTLQDHVSQHGPWPPARVTQFLQTMLEYLARMHDVGIIHRDIKPANIMRTTRGRYVLIDFGIAKKGDTTVMKTFSPYYAPPEQHGSITDRRSDLYSLGATAYYLLTGRPPEDSSDRVYWNLPLTSPADLVSDIPSACVTMITTLLELDPRARPHDARAALRMLMPPTITDVCLHQHLAGHPRGNTPPFPGVYHAAWSPDGETFASAGKDRTIRLWRAADGAMLQILSGHTDAVYQVVWSPDGETLASAGKDRTIRLWHAANGSAMGVLRGHTRRVTSVAWHPDGQVLASGSRDSTIRVWSGPTFAPVLTLQGHTDYVTSMAWSPDGHLLASASDDHTIRLWDGASGRQCALLSGHTGAIVDMAWSPDGHLLASASGDHTIGIWRVDAMTRVHTLRGHVNWVNALAFSPDGHMLSSASSDRTIRLWRVDDGALLFSWKAHMSRVYAVAWSPDGQMLVSGSRSGGMKLWRVITEQHTPVPRSGRRTRSRSVRTSAR